MATKAEHEQLSRIEDKVDHITYVLLGSLNEPDKPGMLERVRDTEQFIAGMNKLKWLLVGATVASVITLVVNLASRV